MNIASSAAVFAVMGTTGSGKSTFIQKATGNPDIVVGHNLKACTQEPWLYHLELDGRPAALLDTPGFDDTYKTDADVLAIIAEFLAKTYKLGIKLRGIIYLHRITDPRMTHGGRANLELFRALCGKDPLRKVVLATTFWGEMKNQIRAEEHEKELRTHSDYWGDMLANKATMKRFHDTQDSALNILRGLLQNEEGITLKIQKEMVDDERDLAETTAGSILQHELKQIAERYEEKIKQLRKEMEAGKKAYDQELVEVKEMQMTKAERDKRMLRDQMDVLRAQTRERLREQDMEFEARMRKIIKEQEVEKDDPPVTEKEQPPQKIDDVKGQSIAAGDSAADEAKRLEKIAKRQQVLEIVGALGTTATAAGLSVINPLAIPVAFAGLISLINACLNRKTPSQLDQKPETYGNIAGAQNVHL